MVLNEEMRIYYFDDSGSRIPNNPKAPFFVLAGFGVNDTEIPELQRRVRATAEKFGMPLGYPNELKFQHVGSLRDNDKKPQWMLRAGISKRNKRRALVYSCLREALNIRSAEAICVAVNTQRLSEEETAIGTALTPVLERVQMNCQDHGSVGLVMMDEEQKDDKALREFFRAGSPHFKYDRIVDTLAFMPSEESIGIQVADLVAGGFSRHMNYGDPGYLRTFMKSAATRNGEFIGCGIKIYHRADKFVVPAKRPLDVPWSKTDREIHEFEFEALTPGNLEWLPNGIPNRVWSGDWDTQ